MKQFIIALIVVSVASLVGVGLWAKLSDEYVEVERIKYKPEYVYVDVIKAVTEIEYVELVNGYDFRYSDNETMSAYEALVWIDGGIRSHQYYIDNPQFQNKGTGDTTFNERIIAQYKRARSLIEKLMEVSNE